MGWSLKIARIAGVPVREAMITRFHALSPDDTLHGVVSEVLSSGQRDFPVVEGSRGVVGILPHGELMAALARGEHEARVGDLMRSGCGSASETEMLEAAFARMQKAGCGALPVVRDGALVGVMSLENVGEWLMIHSRGGGPRGPEARLRTSSSPSRAVPAALPKLSVDLMLGFSFAAQPGRTATRSETRPRWCRSAASPAAS